MEEINNQQDTHAHYEAASTQEVHAAFGVLTYFVAASVLVLTGVAFYKRSDASTAATLLSQETIEVNSPQKVFVNPFENITIEGHAAVVYDVAKDSIIYQKNSTETLPLASLTKLMTALVASEEYSPDTLIAVSEHALEPEGDQGLIAGDTWQMASLAALTLISSSNDGAEALSEARDRNYFINQMNTRAEELGLHHTYFFNPTGLDVSERVSGGYGSAEDVAKLLVASVHAAPSILSNTTKATYDAYSPYLGPYTLDNTNPDVGHIPGLIASKTGFTDLAGGNLAILFDAGLANPVAVVVLGSSIDGRFSDVNTLSQAARAYLAYTPN